MPRFRSKPPITPPPVRMPARRRLRRRHLRPPRHVMGHGPQVAEVTPAEVEREIDSELKRLAELSQTELPETSAEEVSAPSLDLDDSVFEPSSPPELDLSDVEAFSPLEAVELSIEEPTEPASSLVLELTETEQPQDSPVTSLEADIAEDLHVASVEPVDFVEEPTASLERTDSLSEVTEIEPATETLHQEFPEDIGEPLPVRTDELPEVEYEPQYHSLDLTEIEPSIEESAISLDLDASGDFTSVVDASTVDLAELEGSQMADVLVPELNEDVTNYFQPPSHDFDELIQESGSARILPPSARFQSYQPRDFIVVPYT